MTCQSCGAVAPDGAGAFCSRCGRAHGEPRPLPTAVLRPGEGTELAIARSGPLTQEALAPPPSSYAEQFAIARRDPACAEALATRVTEPRGAPVLVLGGMVLIAILGVALLYKGDGDDRGAGTVPFLLAWGAITALVMRHLLGGVAQRAALAYVVDRPPLQSASDLSDAELTSATVVLELEDGQRLLASGRTAMVGALVTGDCGVAYVNGARLIGFRRLAR